MLKEARAPAGSSQTERVYGQRAGRCGIEMWTAAELLSHALRWILRGRGGIPRNEVPPEFDGKGAAKQASYKGRPDVRPESLCAKTTKSGKESWESGVVWPLSVVASGSQVRSLTMCPQIPLFADTRHYRAPR